MGSVAFDSSDNLGTSRRAISSHSEPGLDFDGADCWTIGSNGNSDCKFHRCSTVSTRSREVAHSSLVRGLRYPGLPLLVRYSSQGTRVESVVWVAGAVTHPIHRTSRLRRWRWRWRNECRWNHGRRLYRHRDRNLWRSHGKWFRYAERAIAVNRPGC
jgi:hypothetical protein